MIAEGLSIAAKLPTSSAHQEALPQAQALLGASSINVAKALALYRKPFDPAAAQALLLSLAPEHATLERALILSWFEQAAAMSPRRPALASVATGAATAAAPPATPGAGRARPCPKVLTSAPPRRTCARPLALHQPGGSHIK